jgi:2-dehydro-3-deoxygluconokinase
MGGRLDLIAIGEPLLELNAQERGRLSTVTTFRRGFGGDTSNTVVAAARLGGRAGYWTRLGEDEFGAAFLDLWAREGVDTARVVTEPGAFTGIYFVATHEDGGHEFTYYRAGSAASRLSPADVDEEQLADARVLHSSGVTQAISVSAMRTTLAAFAAARRRGLTVSYDANIRLKLQPVARLRETFEETVPATDIVLCSDEDLGHLYGDRAVDDVADALLQQGPQVVVVRGGARGSAAWTRDGDAAAEPSWEVDVVDATGAGDAFNAGFLLRWLAGAQLAEVLAFANAVGALATTGHGAVAPLPNAARVETLLATGRRRGTVTR